MLKIEYTKKEIPKYSTDSAPVNYTIVLYAQGDEQEIDWLYEQLKKIGNDNSLTANGRDSR